MSINIIRHIIRFIHIMQFEDDTPNSIARLYLSKNDFAELYFPFDCRHVHNEKCIFCGHNALILAPHSQHCGEYQALVDKKYQIYKKERQMLLEYIGDGHDVIISTTLNTT